MTPMRRDLALAGVILTLYAVLAIAYAVRIPAWQTPDEPAHYNYIAQIADGVLFPVIDDGDWDQAYLSALTSSRFAPDLLDELATIEYEDHQPPLYYLLMTPVYALSDGSLLAMRIASVLIGVGIVASAFVAGRLIAPGSPTVAVGAALTLFLPQHIAMTASVNNDGLSWLILGIAVCLLIWQVRRGRLLPFVCGAVAAIGLVTKLNTILLLGILPLTIAIVWWRIPERRLATLIGAGIRFALPVIVLVGAWSARNMSLYGVPDLFGLAAHDRVVVGQLRTGELIAEIGADAYRDRLLTTTFQSAIGQFGWMALPLPGWAYQAVAVVFGVLAIGVVWVGLRSRPSAEDAIVWGLLVLWLGVAVAQYAYYNSSFVQFQGRYLYAGLVPLALIVGVGVAGWARSIRIAAPLIVGGGWIALKGFILWRVLGGGAP